MVERKRPSGLASVLASAPPPAPSRQSAATAELIEQLMGAIASKARFIGLKPSQWTVLRYLAGAAEEARTIGAVARYHLVTHSSASQTVSSLRRAGMVTTTTGEDARVTVVHLTEQAREALRRADPLLPLGVAIDRLPLQRRTALADALAVLARAIATED